MTAVATLTRFRLAGKPRVHFFSTFFYNKLFADAGRYNYANVRRWTSPKRLGGYSILDCDKLVVPIHQGVHWVLAIINLRDSSLHFLDSMGGNDKGALVRPFPTHQVTPCSIARINRRVQKVHR